MKYETYLLCLVSKVGFPHVSHQFRQRHPYPFNHVDYLDTHYHVIVKKKVPWHYYSLEGSPFQQAVNFSWKEISLQKVLRISKLRISDRRTYAYFENGGVFNEKE